MSVRINGLTLMKLQNSLGVKAGTIRGWIRNNKGIPARKVGKQWKFKCSELDKWIESGKSAMD